jgi:hypothetical protein
MVALRLVTVSPVVALRLEAYANNGAIRLALTVEARP